MKAVASVALVKPYVTEEERNYIPPERVLYLFEPESNVRRGEGPKSPHTLALSCPVLAALFSDHLIFLRLEFNLVLLNLTCSCLSGMRSICVARSPGLVRWPHLSLHFGQLLFLDD